ncbi:MULTISPECIES: cell wall elongation regulator TseB-like domain-containing protein [Enterococcus]|uniref:Uncharacterized protein n=1 Tax=Enterococcus sulfureus ATCC 49903 TaxID=1140003 RepID=S0KTR3_9ENTE|nr:DUF5590 domain-containing protein [Enterococcus sulfureus]EOT48042.1 hypothetical protein OMY_00850 [Enterococcus sulfureus ATCC 49903]EOT84102.1 hypothetical protein I573_01828 [Enterococcus sulfureus ATCC 49903]
MSTHLSKKEKRITIVLFSLIVVLLVTIAGTAIIYLQATQPMRQAKKEATELAQKYGNIETVDQFYRLSKNGTSYTVVGENKQNQTIAVFIPKDGTNIKVREMQSGIDQNEAKSVVLQAHADQNVYKENLGMLNDQPVWEVITKSKDGALNYYYVSFSDGKIIKEQQNI